MSVRAKFWVVSTTTHKGGDTTVEMAAVTSGSEENKSFFKFTPSAQLKMGIVNSDTAKNFEPGKEFYVDFTPAES